MDASDLTDLVDQLDDNIDDLEEALEPLLSTALSDKASKLPVLDRAKLYTLVTYAIESILFSYIRLNGTNAKEHPIFRELLRVKLYFEKIKNAEFPEQGRGNLSLDKGAAGRIIKHALNSNTHIDNLRQKQQQLLAETKRSDPGLSESKQKYSVDGAVRHTHSTGRPSLSAISASSGSSDRSESMSRENSKAREDGNLQSGSIPTQRPNKRRKAG